MFAIHRIKKSYLIAVGIVFFLIVILVVKGQSVALPKNITCNTVENVRIVLDNQFGVKDFINQFDLQIQSGTEKKVVITIPSEFNDVYENYNALQKKQGFDLSKYKGDTAVRYTYNVKDYPTGADVKANVIVCDNRVIAGDLCTVILGGGMSTLDDKTIEK